MKKTFTVACMVATLTVFAAAMLTGCKKEENDFVRDRIGATELTTTVHDTIPPIIDTTIVVLEDTHTYSMRLRQWHNRWLGVSGGYLIGVDSVVLAKYEGAQLLNTWRGIAQHRGTATLNVGTTPYPVTVVDDSCWLAAMGNGVYSGSMAGHNVVMTLGPQAIQGPVVLNGQDWTAYLVAHEAIGQRVRFDADGNARGYIIDADGRAAGVITAPYTTDTTPDTTRTETSRDTSWNGCGQVTNTVRNGASHTINHTIVRTGTVTIHYNVAPLTETHTVSETTMYYSQYMVSGSANPSAIGTTASFSGNTVTIGGATLTITPGAQAWCTLNYNSATLTSNGLLVSFAYNGGTGTVTIPVPWNNPDPIFSSVLAAAATDSYTHQIFSQASYRTTYVCVVAQIGSDYRFYWAELAPNMVRADFDSVSITSTEANFYVNHLSDGYYPAMVCDHNNHVTLYRGVVSSVELTTGWQQTYRLAPSNSLAYVMGGSSWTMAGDSGRNAIRGVMNASGQIVADGITVQLY